MVNIHILLAVAAVGSAIPAFGNIIGLIHLLAPAVVDHHGNRPVILRRDHKGVVPRWSCSVWCKHIRNEHYDIRTNNYRAGKGAYATLVAGNDQAYVIGVRVFA